MKNTWKKLLAMTLVASMSMGMLGVGAWAEEDGAGSGSGETPTTYCGKEAHTHSIENGCYELTCNKEHEDTYTIVEDTKVYDEHIHGEGCYVLFCGVEEHTHTDGCYVDPNPAPEPTPAQPTAAAMVGNDTYDTLQAAINAVEDNTANAVTVTLLDNVIENITISNKNIILDLNGKTIDGDQKNTVLTIDGGTVTLTGEGTITGGHSTNYTQGGGVTVTGGAAFLMESGTITGNIANQYGSGVMVYSGTFTMAGGSITDNGPSDVSGTGGGVCVYNCIENQTAQFIMNDGTISDNEAGIGGGVGAFHWRLSADRTSIIINGGTITGNTATNGGGVSVSTADSGGTEFRGRIEINGGTITENDANLGGGVYSTESITAISGGKITGNTAEGVNGFGGGVYVQAGSATLTGAEITGNTAKTGGGVFAGHNQRETTVTMTSGKLFGNTASSAPDAYCNNLTTLTLPDAASMGGTLNEQAITGWYWSSSGKYAWSKDYCVTQDMSVANAKKTQRYLIAAYDLREPVARIVETGAEFTTLQTAMDTAENGQTVEVLRDCVGAALQNAKKITVNIPEGVTVSTNTGKAYALAVAGTGAELTITGAGTVQGSDVSGNYGVLAQNGGTVSILDGTVKGYRAVCGLTNATINVTGESVSIDGTYAGIHAQGAGVNVLVNAGEVKGGIFGMFLSKGASATVEGTAKLSRTKDDNSGFTISLKGPGGDDDTVQHTSLVVNGGTITNTKNAAIAGNGTVSGTGDARHTKITITGGEITSTESWGIYHPQQGEMTITGGTITGITGVEMRAGTLNVSGNAVITGTNTEYKHDPNANGATTIGVGIAISQHVTERPITATITGGTITGYHAVVEHDLQNDPQSEHVSVKIEGGQFTATGADNVTIISDNFEKFITGGYFSDDLDAENAETAKYVTETYAAHPVSTYEGYFHVHQPNSNGMEHDDAGHWGICKGHADCLVTVSEKANHVWNAGVVTVEPTYDTEGLRTFTCTVCGHTRTESIPMRERPTTGGGGDDDDGPTTPTPRPTETPEPVVTPEPIEPTPIETPVIEELEETDTPLAELPTETEQPATEPPKEEFEDLEDEDVPMAQAPETGDSLGTWLMMSAGALFGLAWLGRKKEEA